MPTTRPVLPLLLFAMLFSLPFYLALNLSGGRGEGMRLYVAGLMWCPALAAFAACRLHRIPLSALGWRWPGARIQGAAYLLPLAYSLLVYGAIWGFGLGGISTEAYAGWAGKMLGFADWPPLAHLLLMLVLQASAGFVLSCATALGEEIGWRGFLAPALLARFGFAGGSLATGLLWALWHVPVLFWMNYHGAPPRAYALACFVLSLAGMSFVYSWFRLRSNSLWPAVFLHASHNVFLTPVFAMLTVDSGHTAWFGDEFGAGLALLSLVLGWACWRHAPPVAARQETMTSIT